jgi:hypothetical protein
MRTFPLLLIASGLAACTTAPPLAATEAAEAAEAQAKLQTLIAGKVAGSPVSCLPPGFSTARMLIINDRTIAFQQAGRVYVNRLEGAGCNRLGTGSASLVTRTVGPSLCRGDIGQVTDLTTGVGLGSCVLGDFIPYAQP